MTRRRDWRLGVALVVLWPTIAVAEVPPLKEDQLQADADLIAVGSIESIHATDKRTEDGVDTHYEIVLAIQSVEKGKAESGDRRLVVRGWETKKRPDGWTGPGGHYSYPGFRHLSQFKVGETARWYLQRLKDGKYEVVYPNGIVRIDNKEKP